MAVESLLVTSGVVLVTRVDTEQHGVLWQSRGARLLAYQGRTLPQFVRLPKENRIARLVDVRERPASRKRGFSAMPLFDALRREGITYESDRALWNPVQIRDLWKNGSKSSQRTE